MTETVRSSRRRATLAVAFAAEVLVMVYGMTATVALPGIGAALALEGGELQWAITAYTLPLGAFLMVGGRVSDLAGRRRVLILGLGGFALGSLVAGTAVSAAVFTAGRGVAGLGAALALPAALATVTDLTDEGRDRTRALGWMSASIDIGMVVGALAGGAATSILGWRWALLIVVPPALGAAVSARLLLPESRAANGGQRPDWLGASALAGGLALVIAALVAVQRDAAIGQSALATLAGGALLLALFAVRERRPGGLLPLALLRRSRVAAANLSIVANAGAFCGVLVLGTLAMQRGIALTPLETGGAFVPLGLSALLGGWVAPRLVERFATGAVVAVALAISAAGLAWMGIAPGGSGYTTRMLPPFAVAGFSFAVAAVPLTATVVDAAASAERALAAGLFQTFTHVGGAIVLALIVIVAGAGGLDMGFLAGAAVLLAATLTALPLCRAPRLDFAEDVGPRAGAGRREGRHEGGRARARARAQADRERAAEGRQGVGSR